jgi:MAternally-affected-uncoordination protein
MCRLVMGNKSLALSEISQACGLCQQQPRLLLTHRPQLHTLLGLYAMSMNCMEAAEAQFTAALRVRSLCDIYTLMVKIQIPVSGCVVRFSVSCLVAWQP